MQNDQIYSDITDLIATKTDLNLVMAELDLLETSLYKSGSGSFDAVLEAKVSENLRSLIIKLAGDKKEVLKKLKEETNKIKFLELTLASDPTKKILDRI